VSISPGPALEVSCSTQTVRHSARMPGVTDSNTPANETRQQVRERERQEVKARVRKWKGERRRKRLKRIGVVVGPFLVLLFILTQFGGDTTQDSDGNSGAVATSSPSSETTFLVITTLPGREVRYVSEDDSRLAPDVSLATLWEAELRTTSNAFNGLTSALGLPDQLGNEDGRRVGLWLLAGGGTLEIHEGLSLSIFCGPDNVISAYVGDGVTLCRSTLEEANAQASEGIGVFPFVPDPTSSAAGGWMSCDSEVATEKAHFEFRVNATADDAGSSASEAAPTDIINGLFLTTCA